MTRMALHRMLCNVIFKITSQEKKHD
jgi:hypothetical protein